MNFNQMTVGTRLNAGFGLVLTILVAVALVAIFKVHTIEAALRANNEENASVQRYAIDLRGSAHDRAIATRDVVLASRPDDRQLEMAKIQRLASVYAESAAPLEKLIGPSADSAELRRLADAIKSAEAQAVGSTRVIVEQSGKGDLPAAQDVLWSKAKPEYVQWLAAINALIDFEEARIQAQNKVALEQAAGFLSVMLAACGLALVTGVGLAWSISRGILRQLGAEPAALGDAARRVSDGDLQLVTGAAAAPPGSVLASLAAMQASLARVVGQVRQASDSIATGSVQIATGNADLSQRTEQQASNLQQTAASMAQMNVSVKGNAVTARHATELASSASTAAAKGGAVVGQVVTTMEDITASSRKIADIIGVIDGIAFQTNILALNAAVAAARAGEQGRGFAVVASEVRSLAQRSAEAAREIKSLIGASVEKVESGSRLVTDAGATMDDIVMQVRRVSNLIGEIGASTLAQTGDIDQVSNSVSQLDNATQQNAALVEESAAAAESLKQQAVHLTEVMRVFQLDSPPPSQPLSPRR